MTRALLAPQFPGGRGAPRADPTGRAPGLPPRPTPASGWADTSAEGAAVSKGTQPSPGTVGEAAVAVLTPAFLEGLDSSFQNKIEDFPGGAVVKNPPANAGDTGSSPGPGGSHMPRSD